MTLERNKDLVRRYFEGLFNRHNLGVVDEVFSADYINHQKYDPGREEIIRGRDELKKVAEMFFSAFPDQNTTIADIIAADDKVVTRWITRGTHKGDFMGIAATHKEVAVTGITIDRIADGKIVESWTNWDMMRLMQQIGAVCEPLAAAA